MQQVNNKKGSRTCLDFFSETTPAKKGTNEDGDERQQKRGSGFDKAENGPGFSHDLIMLARRLSCRFHTTFPFSTP
jgi:hypothetical protein